MHSGAIVVATGGRYRMPMSISPSPFTRVCHTKQLLMPAQGQWSQIYIKQLHPAGKDVTMRVRGREDLHFLTYRMPSWVSPRGSPSCFFSLDAFSHSHVWPPLTILSSERLLVIPSSRQQSSLFALRGSA
ncbi:hypothetical protein BC939DRAFT_490438 [Gamsiella multidivaricata]|uniref:uncharacterized protein n=1 Tax=Gamsiella multidivaricata TaxID=101098 RepID=UPI00221EE7F6|nr:uncharacterized protein BC939DRAFT_490438 [Gamsiella multidivaricata]KAI7829425.1 hypothetical protein BC939DRAFT_490438 [Gamsiella multidivaricata]